MSSQPAATTAASATRSGATQLTCTLLCHPSAGTYTLPTTAHLLCPPCCCCCCAAPGSGSIDVVCQRPPSGQWPLFEVEPQIRTLPSRCATASSAVTAVQAVQVDLTRGPVPAYCAQNESVVLSYSFTSRIANVAFGVQATDGVTCTSDLQYLGEAERVVGGLLLGCLLWGMARPRVRWACST